MRRAFFQAVSKMNENGGLRRLFDDPVRPEDALERLHLAAEAPTYDERQTHLEEALIIYTVGVAHQNRGWRKSRRGSKPGKRINDTEALVMMDVFAAGTGKTGRPLAKMVLEQYPQFVGHSFNGTRERLARLWKSQK
jgi:hypothetical protein